MNETVFRGFGYTRFDFSQTLSSFWTMAKKRLVEMTRYPISFVTSFGTIFIFVGIFLFSAMSFRGSQDLGNTPIPGIMTYGFVIFLFLQSVLWDIGFSIREEQVRGTLESIYLSPSNKFLNLVSRVLPSLIWTSLLGFAALAFINLIAGKVPVQNALFGVYLLLMTLSGSFGLAFVLAGLTIKLKQTANLLVNFLQFFFLIFCSMLFPFSILPRPVVQYVSMLIPVSYCIDAFRSTMLGFPAGYPELLPINIEAGIVTAFGLLMPIVGYLFYKRMERGARSEGTLGTF